jgi:hypothetical protein
VPRQERVFLYANNFCIPFHHTKPATKGKRGPDTDITATTPIHDCLRTGISKLFSTALSLWLVASISGILTPEHAMSETPRLGSSYPSTPEHGQQSPASKNDGSSSRKVLPTVPQSATSPSGTSAPLIPLTLIDAPSQRFYVFALYIALLAWRLYDWGKLVEDEADSFWLFIKWVATDGVFLYGLPEMRIPWLEWSNPVTTGIFLSHACLNGMLMFRIPVSPHIITKMFANDERFRSKHSWLLL